MKKQVFTIYQAIEMKKDLIGEAAKKTIEKEGLELEALRVKTILSQPRPIFQSLGSGIHEGVFYYGTKMNQGEELFDAIITSDKKVYCAWPGKRSENEIKTRFGLCYKYELFEETVDSGAMWRREGDFGIKARLFGEPAQVSLKESYELVYSKVKTYWWHPVETVRKFVALDILSTYYMPVFNAKGRTCFTGESGFGKTRALQLYSRMGFNPITSMDFSDSAIFRMIESTNGTPAIDNFDSLSEEKQARVKHLYISGYKRGGKVIRSEGQGKFTPKSYNAFSHMVLTSIMPLDAVSENRSITIPCLKTEDPTYSKEPDARSPEWAALRDKLHVSALQNWKEVQQAYDELKDTEIVARDLEIIAPILALAKSVSEELYAEIRAWFIEANKDKLNRDVGDEWLYQALDHVAEQLLQEQRSKGAKEIKLSVKDVADELGPTIFEASSKDYKKQSWGFRIFLGKAFSNIPLFKKTPPQQGHAKYVFTQEGLERYCRLRGYSEIAEKLKEPESNSPYSPLLPNSPNTPLPPFPPSLPLKKGESGEGGEDGRLKPREGVYLKVRFLRDLPTLLGPKGDIGPFSVGQVAELEHDLRIKLLKEGYCAEVDERELSDCGQEHGSKAAGAA